MLVSAATDTFLPSSRLEGEDSTNHARRLAQELLQKTGMSTRGIESFDLVVDCTGAELCIQTSIFAAQEGGRFTSVGMGKDDVHCNARQTLPTELTWMFRSISRSLPS